MSAPDPASLSLSVAELGENLAAVQARINAACARSGRDPASVRLVPVSKAKSVEMLRAAYAAGAPAPDPEPNAEAPR
ncbi:hypothetical protein AXK11_07915 [Cephaloticoccus primus]|uniref:YggS family pyridoxal phosphate enzyme n=1 Tax=Cephaloticoccus primus TaxID=1548207 RepID=A0A139SJ94_9BACT|nr:hypothetical protein [Cephaloticoccus primus]KXU34648.1 hypothetical protein AXK11_07915 [Cephaloticoccus primus]